MAKKSIEILKTFFETGDYPTESQFADLIDSFIHKDEQLQIGNIEGLLTALQNKADVSQLQSAAAYEILQPGATSYNVQAGILVEAIVIYPGPTIDFSAGTTLGGNDIVESYPTGGEAAIFRIDRFFNNTGTIHFSGININTQIKILKR